MSKICDVLALTDSSYALNIKSKKNRLEQKEREVIADKVTIFALTLTVLMMEIVLMTIVFQINPFFATWFENSVYVSFCQNVYLLLFFLYFNPLGKETLMFPKCE
jgi:uncharacterized protein YqhQ